MCCGGAGPKIDIETLVNTFMVANDVKNTTNILLEYLKPRGNREEDGPLQTKLLEINLLTTPQVAEAIMDHDEYKFTHYDRLKVAQLCERAQLYQKALEHYTEMSDIKRVLSNTHLLNPDFLLEYFGRMTPENCLDCLRDLLKYNLQQNIRLVTALVSPFSTLFFVCLFVCGVRRTDWFCGVLFAGGGSGQKVERLFDAESADRSVRRVQVLQRHLLLFGLFRQSDSRPESGVQIHRSRHQTQPSQRGRAVRDVTFVCVCVSI
jgi:hypothetical protein